MKQLDLQVIQQALDWLAAGKPVWLCTVLSTFGSAPRGPGAMLVALDCGEHRGSLSGGCVEEDFLERLVTRQFEPVSQVVRYGEGGLAPTLALPCGGVLDVLVEHFTPGAASEEHLKLVEQALSGRERVTRQVRLGGSQRSLRPAAMGEPRVERAGDEVSIRMGAVFRLLLAGLSPVAEYCASFAVALGYEVILCDPRTEVTPGFPWRASKCAMSCQPCSLKRVAVTRRLPWWRSPTTRAWTT